MHLAYAVCSVCVGGEEESANDDAVLSLSNGQYTFVCLVVCGLLCVVVCVSAFVVQFLGAQRPAALMAGLMRARCTMIWSSVWRAPNRRRAETQTERAHVWQLLAFNIKIY